MAALKVNDSVTVRDGGKATKSKAKKQLIANLFSKKAAPPKPTNKTLSMTTKKAAASKAAPAKLKAIESKLTTVWLQKLSRMPFLLIVQL